MNKITSVVLGAALAAAGLAVAPVAAAETASAEPAAMASSATDGNFYLYARTALSNQCLGSGGNVSDAGSCGRAAESLWNNGYVGVNDDIWVHSGTGYSGWRRGVYQGVALHNLHEWRYDGGGPELWHNIGSVAWTNLG